MQVYKLTNKNLQTHNGYQWQLQEWHETTGEGQLCSKGWLHFYYSKELALFLNPLHARIAEPRMFVAEAAGQFKDDYGLKGGCTKLRIVEEIPVVMPTAEQCVKFGILCAKIVETDKAWNDWADAWLDGSDRSAWAARLAAGAARLAAGAARLAAGAAAGDAAWAAAWAADAAARADWAAAEAAAGAAWAARAAAEAAAGAAWAARAAEYAARTGIKIDLIAIAKQAME